MDGDAEGRAHRPDDLCRARHAAEDRARQGRRDDQGDLHRRPRGDLETDRKAGAPVPVREGAGELERRSGALSRDGRGIPEIVMRAPMLLPSVIDAMQASPLVALDRLTRAAGVEGRIVAKLDYLLPGFSKKDRA